MVTAAVWRRTPAAASPATTPWTKAAWWAASSPAAEPARRCGGRGWKPTQDAQVLLYDSVSNMPTEFKGTRIATYGIAKAYY